MCQRNVGGGRRTLDLLLISRFAIVSTGWNTSSSAMPVIHNDDMLGR